jgi:broad specificity phosphatase PhoE
MPSPAAPAAPRALWLVRHGQSDGNLADEDAQASGASNIDIDIRDPDVGLSDLGRRQAGAVGKWLGGLSDAQRPTLVLSSPYVRAATTASIATAEAGLRISTVTDERLRERDLGVFDGFTGRGITERFPDEAVRRKRLGKFYYRPPGGESWADVALRVRGITDTLEHRYADERVLVVTHQAVAMLFRYVIEALTEEEVLEIDARTQIANCAITRYELDEGRLVLRAFNDIAHLSAFDEEITEEPDVGARSG